MLHDTGAAMIEQTYSANILEHSEAQIRKALPRSGATARPSKKIRRLRTTSGRKKAEMVPPTEGR
jgi:hypothetical protein